LIQETQVAGHPAAAAGGRLLDPGDPKAARRSQPVPQAVEVLDQVGAVLGEEVQVVEGTLHRIELVDGTKDEERSGKRGEEAVLLW
jgi:hypothetical protein